jgi:hypothetical protein
MAVEIDCTTLEVIQMDNNHHTDDCFIEVLTKWLRNNKPLPCWKNLTIALQSVGIKGMSLISMLLQCLMLFVSIVIVCLSEENVSC